MTACEIPVLATATIGHRVYHLRARGDGFVAVSAEGAATVLDAEPRVLSVHGQDTLVLSALRGWVPAHRVRPCW